MRFYILTPQDWVYWSTRQGRHPDANLRLAKLLKMQHGRCRLCGLVFQHDDRIEVDHIDGDRRNSRYTNLPVMRHLKNYRPPSWT